MDNQRASIHLTEKYTVCVFQLKSSLFDVTDVLYGLEILPAMDKKERWV